MISIPALLSHPPLLPEADPALKAEILLKAFFPSPPTVVLTDTDSYEYTQDLAVDEITLNEVTKVIAYTISNKAPGEDEITNGILKIISPTIASHLQRIFNASIEEGYCPEHFRNSVIIALRKSDKSSYAVASSYRPIALLNIIGKIMKLIIARRIAYLAETHGLLSITHMGARKAMFTEHALHYVVERVHSA